MTRLNWRIIQLNVAEAREQLERLERLATTTGKRSEAELQVGLSHAYHHLNFAWHARRVTTKRFAALSDQDFNRWGEFPKNVDLPRVQVARRRRKSRGRDA